MNSNSCFSVHGICNPITRNVGLHTGANKLATLSYKFIATVTMSKPHGMGEQFGMSWNFLLPSTSLLWRNIYAFRRLRSGPLNLTSKGKPMI